MKSLARSSWFLSQIKGAVNALGGKESTLGGLLMDSTEFISRFDTDPVMVSQNLYAETVAMLTWYKEFWDWATYDNLGKKYAELRTMGETAYEYSTTQPKNKGVLFTMFVIACIFAFEVLVVSPGMFVAKRVLPKAGASADELIGKAMLVGGGAIVGSMLLFVTLLK